MQSRAANDDLNEAEALVRREPGRGIEQLRRVAALYPFNERVHNSALSQADEAERDARKEIDAYREALQDFRIFRSADTLVALEKKTAEILERYPSRGDANGPHENSVAELTKEAVAARAASSLDRHE